MSQKWLWYLPYLNNTNQLHVSLQREQNMFYLDLVQHSVDFFLMKTICTYFSIFIILNVAQIILFLLEQINQSINLSIKQTKN